jgi:electron transfer flavoprotein alpha subunit
MSRILAVLEAGHSLSSETLAAALTLGEQLGLPVDAVEPNFPYTADAFTAALAQFIETGGHSVALFPHTYQVRDFAPRLATRFGRALLSDVIRLRVDNGQLLATRQLFQGKLLQELRPLGQPVFVSLQAGAYPPAAATPEITPLAAPATPPRQQPEPRFRDSQRAVDLTTAPIIVSVGRGIKEQENLQLIEALAAALGAEIAASRPICDNGWLPMDRQVGSSGQTVAPKLYIAVGLSGAIQHLVGMKGARTVVAINTDPAAPIFEVADYGLHMDLFEAVPALTAAILAAKSRQ